MKASPGKLWNFGRLLKEKGFDWLKLVMSDEWEDFTERHNLDTLDQRCISNGYKGLEYPYEAMNMVKIEAETICSFGKYIGKPMSEVPMEYIVYIHEASWLNKWPTVKDWINKNRERIEQFKQGTNEGLAELSKLKQSLA